MKESNNQRNIHDSSGHALMTVLVLTAMALILTTGMVNWASSSVKTRRVVESNTKNFYEVEQSINAATAWLQSNSKNIVKAFTTAEFDGNFDLTDPGIGDNEGSAYAVPTLVKMDGTNNAVQLTNSSYFGTSAFPETENIDTGASFDAADEFENADFGADVNVRILLTWALETDGNYEPIFRIDAVTGGDGPEHGVHGVNFVKSALLTGDAGVGYYADDGDFQTGSPNNECWSYKYSWDAGTSTWSRGAARSNCLITGQDDIQLKSAIHGSVMTNKNHGINLDGGSISGSQCEGAGCVAYTLPVNPEWSTRCASVPAVDITVSTATYDLSSGTTLASQCYRDITVPSNKTLNFVTSTTDGSKPYYIRNLILQNNSNSRLTFDTVGPGEKYVIYADTFSGNKINGNQLVSTNLAPNQMELYITKHGTLTLNGTASMNGLIVGNADHTIKHSGNFTFYGALRSNAVEVQGNARLGYDEDLGGSPVVSDVDFSLYKASQRYR